MYAFDPDRLAKVAQMEADGIRTYPSGFSPTISAAGVTALAEGTADLDACGGHAFAGRLMFKNEMGKAGFGRVLDKTGRLQIYVKKDDVGEAAFALWKKLDLGDIVGVRGTLMRTRTGELTLKAKEIVLLSKCMNSLPDKFHGIHDPEIRQRQRYVDLFVNDETREVFQRRSRIVRSIRNWFEGEGFLEVETPMMHAIPGGATARPFVTHHNALDMALFLRVAPELYLKRLIVGGLERVFEINRNFRNEGIDATHNPEFTMLEFYQAYATWRELIGLTERLFNALAREIVGDETVPFDGKAISFALPFAQRRYDDLVAEALGIDVAAAHNYEQVKSAFIRKHPAADLAGLPTSIGRLWEHVFDIDVEKTLDQPTFVTHFPVEISPLARRNDDDPTIADRFELFIAGREIANGFNELNDPVDQAARFEAQVHAKNAGDHEAMHFDDDYITALTYGMPPTAGEGIGIDRLVMLLTNCHSIRDVILFPTLRPRA